MPLTPGVIFHGPARPITHLGSVDVLLETIDDAPPGSVMVIDNGGRHDEACVGDLMVLEVSWPVSRRWSSGVGTATPRNSETLDSPCSASAAHRSVRAGSRRPGGRCARRIWTRAAITEEDEVFGDDDGVLFLGPERRAELLELAATIQQTEAAQADRMRPGASLREQLDFAGYRRQQALDPGLTLRQHLLTRGNSIEV